MIRLATVALLAAAVAVALLWGTLKTAERIARNQETKIERAMEP